MSSHTDRAGGCTDSAGACRGTNRREFLQRIGLGTAALAAGMPAMAGPFEAADFEKLVPADKKLRPEWVASLVARGQRTVYRGAELEKIGMPVGGICAGQLYLGGDGKLWHWDIFNQHIGTGAEHYARPMKPDSPLAQGFFLLTRKKGEGIRLRPLSAHGWREISFHGEYPIARVEYKDAALPLTVSLEAFSPFVPLNADDSSLPVTVMRFTVKNSGAEALEAAVAGFLENAVCLHSAQPCAGRRRNRVVRRDGFIFLECSAEAVPEEKPQAKRPDIRFDDFEKETYEGWKATGTAFGTGPVEQDKMPAYQGNVGAHGKRTVNSHATAPGNSVTEKDSATGTLTTKPFVIERNYITFLIGGGAHKDRTCINLLVDDKVVLSATGRNDNRMQPHSWDVRKWAEKEARLQIVDHEKGPWGNIGIDDIVFSDTPRAPSLALTEQPDFGTMGIALLAEQADKELQQSDFGHSTLLFDEPTTGLGLDAEAVAEKPATKPLGERLLGAVTRKFTLAPGQSATATFAVTWHFPNLKMNRLPPGRHYGTRFNSALAVAEHLTKNFDRLRQQTHLWHDTWYDSTLPYWFVDRTFLNTSILATSTCYWLGSGRFYGWEGVGCCPGTCTHVWHYAQAVARLFPQLERDLRERTDFGLAFQPDNGVIRFRAEGAGLAIDGQAGCILRAFREHQMSADGEFLKRNWEKIKQAMECLIREDGDGDGILEGSQHNTLDANWYGPVAWLSGMYLAALRASQEMAQEIGDAEFAAGTGQIFAQGRKNVVAALFNGEYFINQPDPKHPEAINSGSGCEIDQVLGQSWAFQVGLGRVLPESETRSALRALWKYNFTPDVGPYRKAYPPGRWYAMPGEAGLLMCTFPRADWNFERAKGAGKQMTFAGYFNECMTGFEYQVAGHMIWEGMVQEGLAITRAIHDRYHASRRNPFNEVECGDHYARAMASYGVFLAACGYEYHGPKGHLGFAPRLRAEDFRAAFTAAEGWGTFSQRREGQAQRETIALRWGKLRLRTLAFAVADRLRPTKVEVTLDGKAVPCSHTLEGNRLTVALAAAVDLQAGQKLEVAIG